ncbi:MAG: SMC-Scp complex subunit ScpB [Bacilli bacterium]|nr:SMC-Scp complex subunit ScpB [Bacilli bacterium]
MEAVIEGLLFIAGDDGLTLKKLEDTLEVSEEKVISLLESLKREYGKENRGITLEVLGGKVKLVTKKEHQAYYEKYFCVEDDGTLSTSALEVLAIVAYNAPVTRSMVDEIRGVSSSHLIRKLLSKNLIEIIGKAELPGRPNLYKVTSLFLDYFGLSDVKDLPSIEVEENNEERELYTSSK